MIFLFFQVATKIEPCEQLPRQNFLAAQARQDVQPPIFGSLLCLCMSHTISLPSEMAHLIITNNANVKTTLAQTMDTTIHSVNIVILSTHLVEWKIILSS